MLKVDRVLIVDDSQDIRDMISINLNSQDCEAMGSDSRDGAMTILQSGWIADLILLDYHMPGMSIKTFLRKLLDLHTFSVPRIVLMTAGIDADKLARELGIPEVLRKPFDASNTLLEIAHCR